MRVILLAAAATLGDLAGCAKPQPLDVMMAPAVCDSVPPPVTPGERVGGELPPGIAAPADSGVVLGVVQQARTGRPLQAASVLLRPRDASVAVPPLTGTVSNAAGGFVLRAVRPGAYTLRTALIGHLPQEKTLTVRPGAIDTVSTELTYMHCVGY
jgi:hypothetical protein